MEEKRRDAGTLAFAGSSADSPASEPSTRRRGGALKRKANALGTSNFSSTSSKRMLTREKAMLASFSPVHNGPLTRARQAPSNMPSAAGVKSELSNVAVGTDGEKPKEEEERNKAIREWEALEAKIEADFEAIRSRDSNVHVVPNHCGSFYFFLCLLIVKQIVDLFYICHCFALQILNIYMETFQSRESEEV